MNYQAALILRERLRRNWSQQGLCRGICAVSYLSKIENGKAEPSPEILALLLERLQLKPDGETERAARETARQGMDLLLSCRARELRSLLAERETRPMLSTASGLEIELLLSLTGDRRPLPGELEACMPSSLLALQRVLQDRPQEAVSLFPCAYTFLALGEAAYTQGDSGAAIEALQAAYDQAAAMGAPLAMLRARVLIGNSYSNRGDLDSMRRHYGVARRLAEALGDEKTLRNIGYNTASTQIQLGQFEEAYQWFSRLERPWPMALHKLAVSCEATGRREEALRALDAVAALPPEEEDAALAARLCAPVRYRLQHADYLRREEYGRLLLDVFDFCRASLPSGYARFHLPWVLAWFRAARQYRRALEVLESFPENQL